MAWHDGYLTITFYNSVFKIWCSDPARLQVHDNGLRVKFRECFNTFNLSTFKAVLKYDGEKDTLLSPQIYRCLKSKQFKQIPRLVYAEWGFIFYPNSSLSQTPLSYSVKHIRETY